MLASINFVLGRNSKAAHFIAAFNLTLNFCEFLTRARQKNCCDCLI